MPLSTPRTIAAFGLALTASCAIVESVATGIRAASRYARGVAQGEGALENGAQTGDWTYTSDSGRVLAQGRYEDDQEVGVWTYTYENGEVESRGEIKDGLREGRYDYGHPNGQPRAIGSFVRGMEFGEWRFWNTRGTLVQRGTFQDGLRHGRWVSFHPSGTLASEGLYHEGVQVGRWRLLSPSGEESLAWTPMPEGVQWVRDTWDDGTLRRTGFLELQRPQGIWALHHRHGGPRLVTRFENGVANGPCFAFGDQGEVIASGEVRLGRPNGPWTVQDGGTLRDVDAGGFALAMPFQGTWSTGDLVRESGASGALAVWLSEASAPAGEDAIAAMERPVEDRGENALAAADVEPDVPAVAQPWTVRELANIDLLVDMYAGGTEALKKLQSRYAKRTSAKKALAAPEGDTTVAGRYVGKPFPLGVFKDELGNDVLLEDLRGQKLVLVVLRGYSRGVCVYCATQTKALHREKALEKFDEMGVHLRVVFPGKKNGLESFKEAYASISEDKLPTYGLLYQNGTLVGDALDLHGTMVIPSTFVIDEDGIVRWAYIGKSIEDRPPTTLIISELEKLAGGDGRD